MTRYKLPQANAQSTVNTGERARQHIHNNLGTHVCKCKWVFGGHDRDSIDSISCRFPRLLLRAVPRAAGRGPSRGIAKPSQKNSQGQFARATSGLGVVHPNATKLRINYLTTRFSVTPSLGTLADGRLKAQVVAPAPSTWRLQVEGRDPKSVSRSSSMVGRNLRSVAFHASPLPFPTCFALANLARNAQESRIYRALLILKLKSDEISSNKPLHINTKSTGNSVKRIWGSFSDGLVASLLMYH
jgi:hypothetical protein